MGAGLKVLLGHQSIKTGLPLIEHTISSNHAFYQGGNMFEIAGSPLTPVHFILTIADGVIVGNTRNNYYDSPTLVTGLGWTLDSVVELRIGVGSYLVGEGGTGVSELRNVGGTAILAERSLIITNNGTIAGGGGLGQTTTAGGGDYAAYSAGGGGGAGFTYGAGSNSQPQEGYDSQKGGASTLTNGGSAGWCDGVLGRIYGGAGGDLGQSAEGSGGLAGNAVKGNSLITWLETGTRLGAIT